MQDADDNTRTIMADLSKVSYLPAPGVEACGPLQPGEKYVGFSEEEMKRCRYEPGRLVDLDSAMESYRVRYPKMPDVLVHAMGRLAMGKPVSRNERRRWARDREKKGVGWLEPDPDEVE